MPENKDNHWRVPLVDGGSFGTVINHAVPDNLVLFLYRGKHGWQTPPNNHHVSLSHQTYVKRLDSITEYPTSEIVVAGLHTGLWQTVWAYLDKDVTYPTPMNKGREKTAADLRFYFPDILEQEWANFMEEETKANGSPVHNFLGSADAYRARLLPRIQKRIDAELAALFGQ